MTRFSFLLAALIAACLLCGPAHAEEPQCSLENIASPEEAAAGWKVYTIREIVDQVDSAPFEEGAKGNWFITRTTTTVPNCRAFDDMGNYSLRSYMLPKIVSAEKIQICQATADGGSVLAPPPPGAKPRPANTDVMVYDTYDKLYAGPCPPAPKNP